MDLNRFLLDFLHGFAGRHFVVDDIAIFFAKYAPYFLVLGFFVLLFRQTGWRNRLLLFIQGALATILSRGLLTEIIRFFYHHPRPFVVLDFTPLIAQNSNDFSFPSGHAAFYFALATAVFLWNKRWGIWYLILAILIGIARIFVGAHWPLDILSGAAVGVGSALAIHALLKPYVSKIKSPPQTATEVVSETIPRARH